MSSSGDMKESKFQKMFSTQQTFRRNKHYMDVLKLNEIQHADQIQRRKPDNRYGRRSSKMQGSFRNHNKDVIEQQLHDIQKFKFRISDYNPAQNNTESSERKQRSKSPKQIKGFALSKHLSRDQANKHKQISCPDERQFNNFYITKHDLSHIPQIQKYSPRNLSIAHQHMNDLYYDCNKKFEECFFDNTTNSCIFNLKKQNDQKTRYFFFPKRQENKPSTDINPDKISKSFSIANHYKPNKILSFYKINGRENPSQFDQRYLSSNKNFYLNSKGRLIKRQINFTVGKYKDVLINREIQQWKNSKNPIFTREQICDYKYFKQQMRRGMEHKQ